MLDHGQSTRGVSLWLDLSACKQAAELRAQGLPALRRGSASRAPLSCGIVGIVHAGASER